MSTCFSSPLPPPPQQFYFSYFSAKRKSALRHCVSMWGGGRAGATCEILVTAFVCLRVRGRGISFGSVPIATPLAF